ncbi:helix-turn-helix domain-containing protein [bacterium]|nr:helix-turn-helix domain-containing protein [bacterium]
MVEALVHYGIKRRSGRYPWGSGGELLSTVNSLASKGLSEVQIASGLGISTKELRDQKAIAKAEQKEAKRLNVIRQKNNGMSVAAISREFNIPASTVRDLLKPNANLKYQIIKTISTVLKKLTGKYGFVDVGTGTEVWMGVPRPKLDNAIALMKNEGYTVHYLRQEQLGTTDKKTSIMVLAGPNTSYKDVLANKTKIAIPNYFSNDSGATFFKPEGINNISSDRVLVKYKDTGGGEKDGLIEMRRTVPELNLGNKAYAQVRIGVDETHFMKGMAVLRDDIPEGYDIIYNTSKLSTGDKLDAMKSQVDVGASRFKAVVKPNTFEQNGKEITGVVNIVGDKEKPMVEGAWAEWDKNLSSQVLGKQAPRIATKQLDITFQNNKAELDEIMSLTNTIVRDHLLREFADQVDRSAIDLKAAALPRQTTNVLLPDPRMKPTEIYAPNYKNGDVVSLIRYPHGGVFEIPTLTVNNKYSDLRDVIGTAAPDAVAIHPDIAQNLSGADFDGDFVLVVPNKNKQLRTSPSLEKLKTFDPVTEYPKFSGMKIMTESQKERLMGDVSNLITDMTIKGANQDEIARAVRHSMVVIDGAKHELNYKQSHIDNGIGALKKRYQGSARAGAATLISRAKSEQRVLARRDHYSIDKETGEKVFSYTEENYINKKTGKETPKSIRSTKMGEIKDGYDLSSGTVIETVYADHANRMKSLGNQARLATLEQTPSRRVPKATATYRSEVSVLDAKYKRAVKARPIERKAQILGEEIYNKQVEATPGMSYADKRKAKGRSLVVSRSRLKARKPPIEITSREWEAIEMGAISPTRLKGILRNADMDIVRSYATPRAIRAGLSTGKTSRAKALISSGYTAAEVAQALGITVAQIRNIDKE